MAVLEGIGAGEGFEPDQIVAAVKAIDIPAGETAAGYGVHFGDQNQNDRAMMMGMQWQGGKLVTVYPRDAAVAEFQIGD